MSDFQILNSETSRNSWIGSLSVGNELNWEVCKELGLWGTGAASGRGVKKGDELGFFAYGGSTHCLIFEPNVIKKFNYKKNDFIQMGQIIAEIKE